MKSNAVKILFEAILVTFDNEGNGKRHSEKIFNELLKSLPDEKRIDFEEQITEMSNDVIFEALGVLVFKGMVTLNFDNLPEIKNIIFKRRDSGEPSADYAGQNREDEARV